ncbi:MAG: hypothetical protein PHO08_04785 [Methylococcales bacterium]|nr:hypothetical protein [Methylococcales bacterium]MDD5631680.1 hypothetical protein [Methylococcales bacterium]
MSIAEQIYEIAKPLPESLALEALHFIEYLSSKNADRAEMSDLTRAQEIVMKQVRDNQDDEIWDDVKTLINFVSKPSINPPSETSGHKKPCLEIPGRVLVL